MEKPSQNFIFAPGCYDYSKPLKNYNDHSNDKIQFNSIYSVIPNGCTTIIFKCSQYNYTRVTW